MENQPTIRNKIVKTLYSNRITSQNKRIHTPPLSPPFKVGLFVVFFRQLEQWHNLAKLYLLKCEVSQLILSPSDCRLKNFNMNIIFNHNINLSPPQRLPMGIAIKNIAILNNSEYCGQSFMHFLFAHFQNLRLQHKNASIEERDCMPSTLNKQKNPLIPNFFQA